ncbi:TIGR03826 family flagellar region protein [Peribacillus frigoritolerans]|uniref:TIGR03826 family flagellar region protein n=1 Tax=Peribacillus frigoritolerans TaxID=450367 RepID=UPI0010595D22|nr:TIGR03826 family flagellar region protein [Peribacillus frigoritolerans]TDL78936.1 hypothetical protein E2R53_15960 [Peribacillus frigoritolerans]
MGELSNCPECYQLFVRTQFKTVCDACYKEEEQKFEVVYGFLKQSKNRMATLFEVEEQTDVEEDLILKFIRQGRIQLANFPNLGYPCQKCGTLIRENKLCTSCGKDIKTQLFELEQEEERRQKVTEKQATYYTIQPKNN